MPKSVTEDISEVVVKEKVLCGGRGHMKRNCPTLQRQPGMGRGTGKSIPGVVSSSGSVLGPSPLSHASHPVATQITVQHIEHKIRYLQ